MSDYNTALWDFALQRYPYFKQPLLDWQQAGAHINDLLLIGFAIQQRLSLQPSLWNSIEIGRPRALLRRLRQYRFSLLKTDPIRPGILQWELAIERWDLALLSGCLVTQDQGITPEGMLEACCNQWHITKDPALHQLVQRLGLLKPPLS